MSLLNSIQQYPMQFLMPSFSPALTSNPKIAKAAQYGGGDVGGGGGVAPAQPGTQAGGAPAAGGVPAGGALAGSSTGGSGIMSQIMKLLGSGSGSGADAIISMLAGL